MISSTAMGLSAGLMEPSMRATGKTIFNTAMEKRSGPMAQSTKAIYPSNYRREWGVKPPKQATIILVNFPTVWNMVMAPGITNKESFNTRDYGT